jgi:hypothetical protein
MSFTRERDRTSYEPALGLDETAKVGERPTLADEVIHKQVAARSHSPSKIAGNANR